MNKNEFDKLRSIKDPAEVPGAVYAVSEYERHGSRHFSYWTLLDADLNEIEKVKSQFSFRGKIEVLHREAERNAPAFRAYDVKEFGNGYIQFVKNEMTDALTISAAKSFTPEKPVRMTNLKKARLAAGLSQSQLAEKAGLNVRTLQDYEQGRKDINGAAIRTMVRLADVLGVTERDLME